MGLLASYFRASSAAPNWMDDRYWHHGGHETAAGVRVSPESALRASAVYACVNIRKEALAACSISVFKTLANGDKQLAPKHPVHQVLHNRPNHWQTPFEWVEMMQSHLDLRGNAYSLIEPGPNGPVDQLCPLHPDRVTPNLYTDGSIDYTIRALDGTTEKYQPRQILHLRGWSQNGIVGLSPISAQRDTIGIALASQDYVSRFLRNDVSPSIVMEHPALLNDGAYKRLQDSIAEDNTQSKRHKALILEEGMKANKIGMSNRDAQIIESDKMTDSRICAMYKVPPHKIALMDAATHSNAEQLGLEWNTDTMVPIAKRWEGVFARDVFFPLFDDPGEYFAEFDLDGFVRGDMLTRYTAYSIARNWGWMSANDVRRKENMNSIGPQGDEYLRPLNMTIEGQPQPKQLGPGTTDDDDDDAKPGTGADPDDDEDGNQSAAVRNRLFALAEESAGRMVRKEALKMRRLLSQYRGLATAKANEDFCAAVAEFYQSHAGVISSSLRISESSAARFCAVNAEALKAAGRNGQWSLVEATILMNEGRVRDLAQLAMGGNVQ